MKRTFLVITLLLMFLLTISSVQAQGGVGWVRFAHASVDAEEVSIAVNGDDWIEDMEYGIIYLYSAFEEGDYDLEFDIGNRDFEDNIDLTLEVEEGKIYTVMVIGSVDDGTLTSTYLPESDYFTEDDLSEETTQIMILNALDADGFDVVDADDDDNLWSEVRDIPYVVWNYVTGPLNLNITEPGDTEEVLLEDITGDIDFPEGDGFRYLFVIAGTRRNPDVFTYVGGYRTLNDLISSDRDLSVFSDAVRAVDFDTSLETQGNYTLFVPTDDAFDEAFDDVDEFLDDTDAIVDMINYHLLLYYASVNRLVDDGSAETALEGEELEFDLDRDDFLVVNDVPVVRQLFAVNGIIYVIEEVLEP